MYKLAGNCLVIRRDGKLGSILDVTPGNYVEVWYVNTPSKTRLACSIVEKQPPVPDAPGKAQSSRAPGVPKGAGYAGRVAAISPLNSLVTVRHADASNRKEYSTAEPQSMTFSVADNCPISDKNGQLIALREIPISADVTVWYKLKRDKRNVETIATYIKLR